MKYVLSFLLTLVMLTTAALEGIAKEQELIGTGTTFPQKIGWKEKSR